MPSINTAVTELFNAKVTRFIPTLKLLFYIMFCGKNKEQRHPADFIDMITNIGNYFQRGVLNLFTIHCTIYLFPKVFGYIYKQKALAIQKTILAYAYNISSLRPCKWHIQVTEARKVILHFYNINYHHSCVWLHVTGSKLSVFMDIDSGVNVPV